ncbi:MULTISPECIES: MFS transporter [Streptosporangium]|uniref:MFS family permease n=1 Tax=Streptosporangium brasiliense TaxID=47480 RepID=A0ABT9QYD4_9ACTN|nr:MFS transporter [Streptosporangium brasiliense]MDP9861622.1 MFS family permease [Streptosporangium brasiliense]
MAIEPYRRLLALPGVRTLLLVGLVARIPSTATGITLTLHIRSLGMGWLAAGVVGTATTVGMAVGAPLAGRFVDRHGLRPVLVVTTVAQLAFWSCAWALPYPALVVASVVAGLLGLPVFSVIRQCLTALVPPAQRRIGFSLDSIMVELSYMTGPALGVVGITSLGSAWTMCVVAVGLTGAGVALILLNPPIRSAEELQEPAEKVLRRQWLTPGLITLLGTASAATFVLTATELALVATVEQAGDTAWTGLAIGLWCVYSLVGGFVYGGLSRGFSPLVLIGAMGLLTVPVGLVGGDWRWVIVALVPAGVLCAPGLSSTVETLSRWVPAGARGEAMGLHGTALLIGGAVSAPIAGAVIDGAGTGWTFALAGLVGMAMVLVALPFWRRIPAAAEKPVPVAA